MEERTFGAWLRRCRGQLGMSQRALAELLAVDKQTVSAWELGRQCPRRAKRQWVEAKLHELLGNDVASADDLAEKSPDYANRVITTNPGGVMALPPMRLISGDGFFVLVGPEEMRLLSLHRQGKLQVCDVDRDEE